MKNEITGLDDGTGMQSTGWSNHAASPDVQPQSQAPLNDTQSLTAPYDDKGYSRYMSTVKPEMLDANGRFKGPGAGVNFKAEGMTPEQFYAFMNEQVGDPMARDGADGGQRARGIADASWTPGVISTARGPLGNWGVPLAMLAAPFAAGAMGVSAAASGSAGVTGGAAVGGSAGIGSGTVLGGAAAPGASGLAGTLGMNAGMGATALNAGALNAGVTLARGGNIGDAVKSGLTAAALSPVGGWAKGAIGDATAGLGTGVSKALSTVGAGAVTGGAGAVMTGQNIGSGIINGVISSGINAAVSTATSSIPEFAALSREQQAIANSLIVNAARGKSLTPAQLISLATAATKQAKA